MRRMDLLDKVKDKVPAYTLAELQAWYKWCDETAGKYTKQVRGQLAFELGNIPEPLVTAMREAFVAAMREAGRHIVTTKLVETVKADPPPAEAQSPAPPVLVSRGRGMTGHGYGHDTGPGPDSPYTPDGVFGDGGESK